MRSALAGWDFGALFSRVRELTGLRQQDLGELTGLTQSTLSMLESGARRLRHIDTIMPVLERLEVPTEVLPMLLSRSNARAETRPPQISMPVKPLVEYEWESPLAIAERLNATTSSNVDDTTLSLLEHEVDDIVGSYEAAGPHRSAPRANRLRGFVQERLDGRQLPQQRRALFRLAAQASGLLGYMAVNAGREALAEAYCTETYELAREIGDQELMMWALGTRSLGAYYTGRFEQAARWAEAGISVNPRDPQAIRLLVNGAARALGKQGNAQGARRAIGKALELTGRVTVPSGLTSCIAFAPYSMARTLANAATAHVSLGDTGEVLAYAEQISPLVEESDSAWTQTLVSLDVATALLSDPQPDVEQAMAVGRRALDVRNGPPIRSVVQRAGELETQVSRWRNHPAVRDYREVLSVWRAEPLAREVAASARMTRLTESGGAEGAGRDRSPRISPRPPA
ncbi:helix-turn-helix domain-containing protein [Streptomyces sp. TRM66268-LWL]|uniref:Helix-turn-helix domain-containing protein n=1 Tax=Streptomyces polyasparticus TaxID=2767826 RepID=A0ABR7SJG0_9ACTN|nr:helix-turn-helix domain-containing protein [Streptomyces polyasparticus]MBC9714473.1 helix-turn-helix domain-containing protein [Streptomyces polyasparticus]